MPGNSHSVYRENSTIELQQSRSTHDWAGLGGKLLCKQRREKQDEITEITTRLYECAGDVVDVRCGKEERRKQIVKAMSYLITTTANGGSGPRMQTRTSNQSSAIDRDIDSRFKARL